jgi:hypothetical protein
MEILAVRRASPLFLVENPAAESGVRAVQEAILAMPAI